TGARRRRSSTRRRSRGGRYRSTNSARAARRPPSASASRSLALQLLQLAFPPLVLLELFLEPVAEDAQGGDESVELVQRVRARLVEVEIELEIDALVAVGDLEDRLRLEVVRAVGAVVDAVRLPPRTTVARVLDVRHHVRAAVEAGQIQEPALVDASAVRNAHGAQLLPSSTNSRQAGADLRRSLDDAARLLRHTEHVTTSSRAFRG